MSPPQVIMMPLVRLRPNKRNPRTHPKKQIRQLAQSIQGLGWTGPILVDERENILAGHARYEAAKLLGLREIPVTVVSGLSEARKRALALADNRIAERSGWDRGALAAELGELAVLLPECDLNIDITGFETAEIDALMGDLADPDCDPADNLPSLEQRATSALGDLWELGPHRLLCGNSLIAADVRTLMGTVFATMVIADAPYNLRIKSIVGRGRIRHREFAQASGEMSTAQFTDFLRKSMALATQHLIDGSIAFWFIDWRHIGEMLAAGKCVYGEPKNLIVWAKSTPGLGTFYRSQHELIFVFKYGNAPHLNNFELGQHGRNRSNVWTYAGVNTFRAGRMDDLATHPTVKPVALIADAMRDCSRRGDIVLDPFMGSGSTILAAERVGRRGYGLELDPLYVDAAVRRWQQFTRRDAILKATGATFDEVADARVSSTRARRVK